MEEPYGGFHLVYILSTRAAGAGERHLEVAFFQFELLWRDLGECGNGRGGGMDTARPLRGGYALYAMYTGLVFQSVVGTLAFDFCSERLIAVQ